MGKKLATLLAKIIADFTTTLSTEIAVGGTSATLQSATDDDGVALPSGRYFFTLDGANSSKEHISCDLSGTSLTNIKTVSRQGAETSGVLRKHRIGATVSITDFAHILQINNLLAGTTDLNSSVPLKYDGTASISNANHLATKAYVDGVAIAGGVDASTTTKGITKMSVAPASAASPIAVGDNDPRVPTQDENDALAGTSGTPSSSNKYVTDADTGTSGASKVLRLDSSGRLPSLDASQLTSAEISASYIADAPINLGDSVVVADGSNITTYLSTTNSGSTGSINAAASSAKWASQSFTVPSGNSNLYINTATIKLDQSQNGGQPTATLTLSIRATSGNSPTGSDLATANTVSHSTFGSGQSIQFTFATPVTLTAGTTYAFVIRTSTGGNYTFYGDYISTDSGSNWSSGGSGSTQALTYVYGKTNTAGHVLPANASNNNVLANNFIGFAESTVAQGASVKVMHGGVITGLSGLTVGSTYYLSNTFGAISTSAGSQSRKVGIAVSTTTLLIKQDNP